ncbi:hypothetical protein CK203_048641 [Vitis vinifera]|uniref:Uncharacterized protein n=1 Tax=Vitis vinifera TaxID=29760 RepID=A0A438HK66_VITVI|nr:hypothetical protein CK203_048641 [Vitis vinifera]
MENQQIGPQAEPKDKMLEDSKVCMNSSGMTGKGKPSIIGSGATDHMIEYKKLFTLYVPSPQNHRVKIVDRTRFREGRLAMLRISKGYTTSRRTFLCVVEFKLLCAILP